MENIISKFCICDDERIFDKNLKNYLEYFFDLPEGFSIKPFKGRKKFWLAVLYDSTLTQAQAQSYFTAYAIEKGYLFYAFQDICTGKSRDEGTEFTIDRAAVPHEAILKVEGVKAILGPYRRKLTVDRRKIDGGYEVFIRPRRPCIPEQLAAELIRYLLNPDRLKHQSSNWLTVREAAQKMGVTSRRINEMIKSGLIKAEKFGEGKTVPWMVSAFELRRVAMLDQRSRGIRKMANYLKEKGCYYNKQKGKKRGWWHADRFLGLTVRDVIKTLDSK